MSKSLHAGSDQPAVTVALMVRTGHETPRFRLVEQDGFAIGSGDHCQLQLAERDFPRWHSTLHLQGQAVWIETADVDTLLTINGEAYRRRALRDGDRLTFGDTEIAISIGDTSVQAVRPAPRVQRLVEELSQLSADELCDRIEREELQVHEFHRRRRFGWQALLSAVQEARENGTEQSPEATVYPAAAASLSNNRLDELATQVRDLSETLEERTKTLSSQESLLIESSAQLAEVQLRVSRQLEQLLDRLSHDNDQPGELRVSA